ncbi:MAG TPA: carbon-nitrogen hydrolase family protein [Arachnia sp.]|nr:carbon-nitrogen hydrolase family protein [Arachnia sp.]HMT87212.1 carbon-nitrogen hydrolase family protein [Arachnia sp.]
MDGSDVGVAVAQFAPGPDPAANLETIATHARRAAGLGAEVLVVPEYASYFTRDLGPDWLEHAQPLDGPFVTGLRGLADELGIHLVAGVVETGDGERVWNTTVAVAPGGGIVARYRKLHLYDAFGSEESRWVLPGRVEQPELFEVGGLRFGIQACYDLRFPETTRRLAVAGADVVCLPAEWVRGPLKEFHWRTLVTARAIENTVYLAAAGHTPSIGIGNSMLVDPTGTCLAGLAEEPGVAVARFSTERIRRVRRTNPSLDLRRFDVIPRT